MYDTSVSACRANTLFFGVILLLGAVGCGGDAPFELSIEAPSGVRLVGVSAVRLGFETFSTTLSYGAGGALTQVRDATRAVDQHFETNRSGYVTAVVDGERQARATQTKYHFDGARRVSVQRDWTTDSGAYGAESTALSRDPQGPSFAA